MATQTAFTQAEKVAEYLKAGRTLTAREALARWDIRNLRARIFDLRQEGMRIGTIPYTRRDGVNAVKYVLEAAKTSAKPTVKPALKVVSRTRA